MSRWPLVIYPNLYQKNTEFGSMLIRGKEEALQQTMSMMETEKGVSGFRQTKENLQNVS